MRAPELLPSPRSLLLQSGFYSLPARAAFYLSPDLPRANVMLPLAERLRVTAAEAGTQLELVTGATGHTFFAFKATEVGTLEIPESYRLTISRKGVAIEYSDIPGLRAGIATLRQLLRQYGRQLPCMGIRDHPDFPRRGVMLDISRGRVPNLDTLLNLAETLADFKINELQLYIEHTFAYRDYEAVWGSWGALRGQEVLLLDQRCRELGIDLVPNQNSFGHMRYWLESPPLHKLAEVDAPYDSADGTFLRYPSTLSPANPGTLPFIAGLYDELLPHFTSGFFNVGCDETWDLGLGQSRTLCEQKGRHKVYVDFLKQIHKEVRARGRRMMFWGDIILYEPALLKELPEDMIALNWGYEANHPFPSETAAFAASGRPYYVCPGTSTWMTLIGRHDNALANLDSAAKHGLKNGALGYLNTDWGDGGHPQPLAVSWLPYVAGAALSWCRKTYRQDLLISVLSREVFHDPTLRLATAALALGHAHRKFKYHQPNVTPFGAVIAAPLPETRELMCRDGLKYYARIPRANIEAAMQEVLYQNGILAKSRPSSRSGNILKLELDMAASMAVESCRIMLWQQALAGGKTAQARAIAKEGISSLKDIDSLFSSYWPLRNKGDTRKCTPFLQWRIQDYRSETLHFAPEKARVAAARWPEE